MTAMNMSVVIEHHMADSNRCDFTVSAMIEGRRRLLVVEAKGQWHDEVFTAASAQLNERYASHRETKVGGRVSMGLRPPSSFANALSMTCHPNFED